MMAKPEACNGCPMRNIGLGFVPGRGTLSPDFVGVAQAPGSDEVHSDDPQPLIGPSGRIFNRALYENGVQRGRVYLTNVLKCQPPNDRLPGKEILGPAVAHCTNAYLRKELAVVQGPVLAIGGLSLYHMTGKELPILTYRGYPYWSERYTRWVIGTIHPAMVFKTATGSADKSPPAAIIPALQSDIRKINRFSKPADIEENINPTDDEVREVVSQALDQKLVSIDIETPGFEKDEDEVFTSAKDIHLIGVSVRDNAAIVCSPTQFNLLEPIFNPKNRVVQIGQNYVSDLLSLSERYKFRVEDTHVEDIMLQFHALYSDLPKRLAVIASFFTTLPWWKLGKKDWKAGVSGERFKRYNAKDTIANWMCFKAMKPLIEAQGLTDTYHAMLGLIPFAVQMHELGVNVNIEAAHRIMLEHLQVNQAIQQALQAAVPGFNIDSPMQVMELLYDRMGLPEQTHKVKGVVKRTSNDEALTNLQRMFPHNKTLGLIQTHRGNNKIIEYIDHPARGRVHSSLKITGTSSGRLEGREPNLMQQPDIVRIAYIADAECDA